MRWTHTRRCQQRKSRALTFHSPTACEDRLCDRSMRQQGGPPMRGPIHRLPPSVSIFWSVVLRFFSMALSHCSLPLLSLCPRLSCARALCLAGTLLPHGRDCPSQFAQAPVFFPRPCAEEPQSQVALPRPSCTSTPIVRYWVCSNLLQQAQTCAVLNRAPGLLSLRVNPQHWRKKTRCSLQLEKFLNYCNLFEFTCVSHNTSHIRPTDT